MENELSSLERLNRLKDTLLAEGYWQDVLEDISYIEFDLERLKDYDNIIGMNKLKCTKIIIKKDVSLEYVMLCKDAKEYNSFVSISDNYLTEEEYKLIRSELK